MQSYTLLSAAVVEQETSDSIHTELLQPLPFDDDLKSGPKVLFRPALVTRDTHNRKARVQDSPHGCYKVSLIIVIVALLHLYSQESSVRRKRREYVILI